MFNVKDKRIPKKQSGIVQTSCKWKMEKGCSQRDLWRLKLGEASFIGLGVQGDGNFNNRSGEDYSYQ